MSFIQLTKAKKDQQLKVVKIDAGIQAVQRLSVLGIRPGMTVTKVSSFVLRGPVALRVGRSTIAIGHGMAEKIFVEHHPASHPPVSSSAAKQGRPRAH